MKPKFNWEINFSNLIPLMALLFAITGAWFQLPQQIMANTEKIYVRKDVNCEQQKAIVDRLDRMAKMMEAMARRMK